MNDAEAAPPSTVSVVVPCFNSGALVREAVESIRSQTGRFSIVEIALVNDRSSDAETLDALAGLKSDPLVRIIDNTRSQGPAGARNMGAFAAQGAWLAFLDADDVWLPDSLAARFAALEDFPDAQFIAADFQLLWMKTGVLEENFFASRAAPAKYYGEAYRSGAPVRIACPALDALHTVLCHSCSLLVRRDLFLSVGGFEERLRYKEDQHLWFKLAQKSDLIIVPRSVFLYRQHDSNMTNDVDPPFDYERKMLDLILAGQPAPEIAAAIHARYPRGLAGNARWLREQRQFGRALRECLGAIRRYPSHRSLWRELAASAARKR